MNSSPSLVDPTGGAPASEVPHPDVPASAAIGPPEATPTGSLSADDAAATAAAAVAPPVNADPSKVLKAVSAESSGGTVSPRPIAAPAVGPAQAAPTSAQGQEGGVSEQQQQQQQEVAAMPSSEVAVPVQPQPPTSSVVPFPPLESEESILQHPQDYVGPTDESNWVIPGLLLVGAYPSVVSAS